jgi:hypothetical protein
MRSIAVLLVDPLITQLHLASSHVKEVSDKLERTREYLPSLQLKHPAIHKGKSPYPHLVSVEALPLEANEWENTQPPPRSSSIFDDLILFYTHAGNSATSNPITAMLMCQRYVRYKWAGYLQTRLDEYWKLYNMLHFKMYSERPIKT